MKRNVWVGIFYLNTIVNAVIALRIYPNPICIFNAFVAEIGRASCRERV